MKVVVRDIGAELDDLIKMRMQTLIDEEKERKDKGWSNAAEYYHARYIEAESIRKMIREFFQGEDE